MQAYGSTLTEKLPRVGDIVSFRFERPEPYRFQAGQWFVITFSTARAKEPWEHHFSHSDSPLQPWLEFTTRLRGSDFKNALDGLPMGARVELEGPYGSFVLPTDVERAAFLAGGIGITCVRSIVRWLCDACDPELVPKGGATGPDRADLALREAVLLFANRSDDAIPFKEELEELTRKLPGFRVVHVLSEPGGSWQGYRGHLDQHTLERELAEPASWHYFVSGPPSFDQAMQQMLVEWGIGSERIKTEQFLGY